MPVVFILSPTTFTRASQQRMKFNCMWELTPQRRCRNMRKNNESNTKAWYYIICPFHCSTPSSRLFIQDPHLSVPTFPIHSKLYTSESLIFQQQAHHFLDNSISKLLLPQLHLRWVVPRVWWSCALWCLSASLEELHPMCVRMVGDVTNSSYVCETGTRRLLYVGTSIKSRLFFWLFCRSGSVTWPKRYQQTPNSKLPTTTKNNRATI